MAIKLSVIPSWITALFEDKILTDYTVHVADKIFQLHKVVLAGRIPQFKALFQTTTTDHIVIRGQHPETIETILKLCYDLSTSVSIETLTAVLELMKEWGMSDTIERVLDCMVLVEDSLITVHGLQLLCLVSQFSVNPYRIQLLVARVVVHSSKFSPEQLNYLTDRSWLFDLITKHTAELAGISYCLLTDSGTKHTSQRTDSTESKRARR